MGPTAADDDRHEDPDPGDEFRCAFVTLVGRPNVGKSSLVNAICGAKVSIVSDKPQTTRHRVRGIYNEPGAQLVFVDTPGLHKPVTALGAKVNATAIDSVNEADATVDVVCLVVDATAPLGAGDRWVAAHVDLPRAVVVVNKVDRARPAAVLAQLAAAADWPRPTSPCRRSAGTDSRRWSAISSAAHRSVRRCSRPTSSATCPRSSGWPSSSASSCSP